MNQKRAHTEHLRCYTNYDLVCLQHGIWREWTGLWDLHDRCGNWLLALGDVEHVTSMLTRV